MKLKAKVWVSLQVEVEVEGHSEMECRDKAVKMIDDFEPEQMENALIRAKQIGRDYPQDVTEIVEISDTMRQEIHDEARRQQRRFRR